MNIWNHFCGSHWDFLPAPIDVFEEMQIILVMYSFNRNYPVRFWNFKFIPVLQQGISQNLRHFRYFGIRFGNTSEKGKFGFMFELLRVKKCEHDFTGLKKL